MWHCRDFQKLRVMVTFAALLAIYKEKYSHGKWTIVVASDKQEQLCQISKVFCLPEEKVFLVN